MSENPEFSRIEDDSNAASGHRPARVLLAEDNPVNRVVACHLLQRCGCVVTIAVNGREAVERWQQERFDAIFMDIQMPEMDGLEATRIIRERERQTLSGEAPRRIPIIAITAQALTGDRETCLAAGMDAYLSKPVKPAALSCVLVQTGLAPSAGAA